MNRSIDEGLDIARPIELYRRIKLDIEGKILSGEWSPGHRLPSELEFMAQYKCARMTVNKVMSGLAAAGLIERRRRAGTFVARQHSDSAVLRIPNLRDEVAERGAVYRYRLIARAIRLPDLENADESDFAQGHELLELESLHFANERPFAYERRIISLAAVPDAIDVDFESISGGAWLMDHVPWSEATHRIGALNATAQIARLLKVAVGEALLSVERRTWRLRDGITQVWQYFPADMYHLSARFTPNQAGADDTPPSRQRASTDTTGTRKAAP